MTEREVRIINGKEVALYRHKELDSYLFSEDAVDLLLKAFEEVEQYRAIGTVEELQAYKNGSCTNNCSHYDNVVEYVRNNAIDDFAEKLCEDVESFTAEVNGMKADLLTLDYLSEIVFKIAEQLKGGAE